MQPNTHIQIVLKRITINLKLLQLIGTMGILTGGAGALVLALDRSVKASDLELHPPKLPWSHSGWFDSLDHAR